jgi:hypothetical protein
MESIIHSGIWKRTLAEQDRGAALADPHAAFRSRLREAFFLFREKAGVLAEEIPLDLKHLTVHDLTHIDALWQIADMIVGEKYPFTPTEAFVLGGAFLLHDLGMALASYPDGIAELQEKTGWKDAAAQLFRRKHGRAPRVNEMSNLDEEIKRAATEQLLRLRHAEQAENLAVTSYRHTTRDTEYFLIENADLRKTYGRLIGRIAYSHWWPANELSTHFNDIIGAFPGSPSEWTIDPLKLALVVRVADACHLDVRRAPGFLRALRKPTGESERHWRFQEYVQTPNAKNGRLEFSTPMEFPLEDVDVWWLGYEMLNMADDELRKADMILRDTRRQTFVVNCVAGANDPDRLTRHFRTKEWKPVPTKIQVSDVSALVRNLGGTGLYGENPRVPLRELIQNARDAVVARRIKEKRDKSWGEITVSLLSSDAGPKVEVQDTGVGMSEELLTGPFLDFGTSYYNSSLMLREHPGLVSQGFESQGRFGIGFFSVFMWGEHVKVVTRRPEDGRDATRVLEFHKGLSARPILRTADTSERLMDPGTVVHVWLDKHATDPGGFLGPGPIESRFNMFQKVNRGRGKEWRLKNLCAWLCPAVDVDLYVVQDEVREISMAASDWETIDGASLLRRLLLHRDDIENICETEIFNVIAANVRDIRDESGSLLGRGAFKSWLQFSSPEEDPLNQASNTTAGLFRAFEEIDIAGLLLGRPERASRSSAKPIAFYDPDALSKWATGQADLVPIFAREAVSQIRYAMIIRIFGGDTCGLLIARSNTELLSFNSIAARQDLPHEILLQEDHWGVAGFECPQLPANAIAVGSARMRALHDNLIDSDPRRRADHPRWKQFWMSLWGATIEAIAQAWGVPLQDVLEASEIAENGMEKWIGEDGSQYMKSKVDVIRKPR